MTRVSVLGSGGATPLLTAVLGEDPAIERVDLGAEIRSTFADTDLVIGPWVENPTEARETASAAISAGVPYLSPSSSPEVVEALLGLDSQARAAGTLIVAGMGWSPGITNLMATRGAASVDVVRELDISWVASTTGSMSSVALNRAVGLLAGEAMVLSGGERSARPAGKDSRKVFFPEPVGWRTLRRARAAEPMTLPAAFPGLEGIDVGGGLTDVVAGALVRSSAALPQSRLPGIRPLSGKLLGAAGKIKRAGQPWSALRVDVTGPRNGVYRTMSLGIVDQLPNLLVAPIVVAVQSLSEAAIRPAGALPPEAVFEPEDFFRRLSYRGVRLATLQLTP